MGIEPTWDFVEPHLGFEDQERHQVALRLQAYRAHCPRLTTPRAVGTFSARITPDGLMGQSASHFKTNTHGLYRVVDCQDGQLLIARR